MTLDEALRVVSEIKRVEPELSLSQLHLLFLLGKEEEGTSLTELASKAGLTLATASRYIAALGKLDRHHEEGLKLVESYEDPMERRKKIIRLTAKGRGTLARILGGKNANLQKG